MSAEIDFDDENDGFSSNSEQVKQVAPPPIPEQLRNSLQAAKSKPTVTPAVIVQNLDWKVNEEDVRGYAVDIDHESDIKLVIFDEHRINGKSKGNVYVEMKDENAAEQLKLHILSLDVNKKYSVNFVSPTLHPFKQTQSHPQSQPQSQPQQQQPQQHQQQHLNTGGAAPNRTPHVHGHNLRNPYYQQKSHYNSNHIPNYNPNTNYYKRHNNSSDGPASFKRQRQ